MNEWDGVERRLDELVRPSLVVEPPPAVRTNILAAVLLAADWAPAGRPPYAADIRPAAWNDAGLSPIGYAAVAALIAAYAALVGLVGGLGGSWEWVPILVRQLTVAAELLGGSSADGLSGALLQRLAELAPWLALTPVLWLLWERDRAALRGR